MKGRPSSATRFIAPSSTRSKTTFPEAVFGISELRDRRFTRQQFPDAWNAWDSLAEIYAAKGDSVRAVTFYRRSLELNPGNDNARKMLSKIGAVR